MSRRYRSRSRSPGSRRRDRSRSPPSYRKSRRSRSRSHSPAFRKRNQSPPRWGRPRPERYKRTICSNFARGKCFRGASCWFLHDDGGKSGQNLDRTWEERREHVGRDTNDKSKSVEVQSNEDITVIGGPRGTSIDEKPEAAENIKPGILSGSQLAEQEVAHDSSTKFSDRSGQVPAEIGETKSAECFSQVPPSYAPLSDGFDRNPGNDSITTGSTWESNAAEKSVAETLGIERVSGEATLLADHYEDHENNVEAREVDAIGNASEVLGSSPEDLLKPADTELKSKATKKKIDKESRALKVLRNAVTDYVKESLKPAWKEGHLSKEAFKTIAQKAVEKVMSTLQGHEIPKGQAKVEQFMDSSHAKIARLVQGYLEKYAVS